MIYILAEGKTDIALVQYILYIKNLIHSCMQIQDKKYEYKVKDSITIVNLDGQTNLLNYLTNTLANEYAKDKVSKILIINDADNSYKNTKKYIEDIVIKSNIDKDLFEVFILPNNKDDGILEELLLDTANDDYKSLIGCYRNYKECLKNHNIPNYEKEKRKDILKDEVFVYTIHFGCKPEKSYGNDTSLWDINHKNFKPLIDFLTSNIKG